MKTQIMMRKAFVALFGFLFFASIVLSVNAKTTPVPQTKITKTIATVKPSAKPVVKATPAPKPTPTPNYGYCLYVPVILYHHIEPQVEAAIKKHTSLNVDNGYFELQMAYLNKAGYTTITALDLVNALRNHTGLPPKSILVTLDDGYDDLYTNAYPILKKYNIKASLLIPSGLINNPGYSTWDQLREMQGSGLIYFIDHTWSHYPLASGSLDKIKTEIETAKAQLEQNTGQTSNIFGYPYGSFSNLSIQVLQQDGFLGAFSTIGGYYQCDSFIMTLHRNHVGNTQLSAYGL